MDYLKLENLCGTEDVINEAVDYIKTLNHSALLFSFADWDIDNVETIRLLMDKLYQEKLLGKFDIIFDKTFGNEELKKIADLIREYHDKGTAVNFCFNTNRSHKSTAIGAIFSAYPPNCPSTLYPFNSPVSTATHNNFLATHPNIIEFSFKVGKNANKQDLMNLLGLPENYKKFIEEETKEGITAKNLAKAILETVSKDNLQQLSERTFALERLASFEKNRDVAVFFETVKTAMAEKITQLENNPLDSINPPVSEETPTLGTEETPTPDAEETPTLGTEETPTPDADTPASEGDSKGEESEGDPKGDKEDETFVVGENPPDDTHHDMDDEEIDFYKQFFQEVCDKNNNNADREYDLAYEDGENKRIFSANLVRKNKDTHEIENTTHISIDGNKNVVMNATKPDGTKVVPDQARFNDLAELAAQKGNNLINFGNIKTPEYKARLYLACISHTPPVKMNGAPDFTNAEFRKLLEGSETLKKIDEKEGRTTETNSDTNALLGTAERIKTETNSETKERIATSKRVEIARRKIKDYKDFTKEYNSEHKEEVSKANSGDKSAKEKFVERRRQAFISSLKQTQK